MQESESQLAQAQLRSLRYPAIQKVTKYLAPLAPGISEDFTAYCSSDDSTSKCTGTACSDPQNDGTNTGACHTPQIAPGTAARQAPHQRRGFNILGAPTLILPARGAGLMN
ncbi:hypothetical protein D9M71_511200 [compost metagenome]